MSSLLILLNILRRLLLQLVDVFLARFNLFSVCLDLYFGAKISQSSFFACSSDNRKVDGRDVQQLHYCWQVLSSIHPFRPFGSSATLLCGSRSLLDDLHGLS